jgi:hypothetical protein
MTPEALPAGWYVCDFRVANIRARANLGLKLAFRGLNGLSFHNPGAFWALWSLPRGHLSSNTP